MTPEGLHPLLDVGIYGRVASMELYRPPVRAIQINYKYNHNQHTIITNQCLHTLINFFFFNEGRTTRFIIYFY